MRRTLGITCLGLIASCTHASVAAERGIAMPDAVETIRLERAKSNAAIAARDLRGTIVSMLPDYRATWALSTTHRSRDSVAAALGRQYADSTILGCERTPISIQISGTGPAAAEYGNFVCRRQQASGIRTLVGTYYASWQRLVEGWRLNSEVFVALRCTGSTECPRFP